MKRINKSISKDFLPSTIYLDDLKNIENILKEEGVGEIFIVTNSHEYESVSDLVQNCKETKHAHLEIRSRNPYISIDFSPIISRFYASEDNTKNLGIAHKIENIVKDKQNSFAFYFNILFPILSPTLIVGTFFLSAFFFKINQPIYSIVAIFLAILLLYFLSISYSKKQILESSKIFIVEKATLPTFWERKKDDIFVGIIIALLSSIAGFLLGYWLPRR